MKKFLLSTTFVATFALLAACGDDVTEVTEVNEIHQDGIAILGAGEALGTCGKENVGEMLYVSDSAEVYFCDGGAWRNTRGVDGEPGKPGADGEDGDDGNDGESCTAEPVKNSAGLEGLEVTCGKTVVGTIWNGEKGEPGADGEDGDDGNDGESCTAKPVKNDAGVEGLEVTCGKTVVGTIWNGEKGEPGADGDNGNDGESCTAESVTNSAGLEGLEVTCGKTVVGTIWNGEKGEPGADGEDGDDGNDGESCTAESVTNSAGLKGLEVTCGKTVVGTIWNGEKGEPGADGDDGNDGESCTAEPVKNSAGLEGLKVTCGKTVVGTIWNGEKGEPGKDGEDGKDLIATTGTMGSFIDNRDGQIYKTVVIGTQTWMAQNLNYEYNYGTAKSYCYGNVPDNCDMYGRLYMWSAAMDSAEVFSTSGKGCGYADKICSPRGAIRGVCPEGWHLPSKAEWDTLFTNVGGINTAGTALKFTSGWIYDGNGGNSYGFAVLPAGDRYVDGNFGYAGEKANFWSSSEYSSINAYLKSFHYDSSDVDESISSKIFSFSVRCLRN